jgi:hypothetical protein
MRGKKAKTIRKMVYGDFSLKERKYSRIQASGTIVNTGRRHEYRMIKAASKKRGPIHVA